MPAEDTRGGRRLLFDKLTDHNPEQLEEDPLLINYSRDALYHSVKKELTDLLNDRCKLSWSDYKSRMSVPYGFPDAFGLLEAANHDKGGAESAHEVAEYIQKAIERFEPRLHNVEVKSKKDQTKKTFGYTIEVFANLMVSGKVERFSFPIMVTEEERKRAEDEKMTYDKPVEGLKWPAGRGKASVDKI